MHSIAPRHSSAAVLVALTLRMLVVAGSAQQAPSRNPLSDEPQAFASAAQQFRVRAPACPDSVQAHSQTSPRGSPIPASSGMTPALYRAVILPEALPRPRDLPARHDRLPSSPTRDPGRLALGLDI